MSDLVSASYKNKFKIVIKNHFDTFKRKIHVVKESVDCPEFPSGVTPPRAGAGCVLGPSGYLTGVPSGMTITSSASNPSSYDAFYDQPQTQYVSVRAVGGGNYIGGSFQPLVAVFFATISFEKPTEGYPRADVIIKVEKDCRDFIMDVFKYGKTDKIIIDGNSYKVVSEDYKKSFLSLDYFVIYLNSSHTNANVNI